MPGRPPKRIFATSKPQSRDGALAVASGPTEEDAMTSVTIDVPLMYADHHVVEVRRILFEVPGVKAVEASSAFQVVKVEFDPEATSEEDLRRALDENGYLGELQVPLETGKPAVDNEAETYFRHTAAYEAAGKTISFGQAVAASGRPLGPGPGMKPARKKDE